MFLGPEDALHRRGAEARVPDQSAIGPRRSVARGERMKVHFEGVKALDGVDLALRPGRDPRPDRPERRRARRRSSTSSAGSSGPTRGTRLLDGGDVTGVAARGSRVAGLVRTFQGVRLFAAPDRVARTSRSAPSGVGRPRRAGAGSAPASCSSASAWHQADAARRRAAPRRASGGSGSRARSRPRPHFLLFDEPAAGPERGREPTSWSRLLARRSAAASAAGCS